LTIITEGDFYSSLPACRLDSLIAENMGSVPNFNKMGSVPNFNKWLPVVRYDTEHGFAHRDLFDSKGNKSKTPMFTEDYNKALTFAEYDIKSNWKIYKKAFLGGAEYEEDNR
jgi:hypothetical protein